MAGVSRIKRGDSRFYIDPEDAHSRVPGVTSVVDQLPKSFLKFWAVKVTAEAAVEHEDVWLPLARRDPQGAVDYLKGVHRRVAGEAAGVGSRAHTWFERAARGEAINPRHVPADVKHHVRWFMEFLDQIQPEFLHLEQTVWSDRHQYAGSFDALARIDGEVVMLDWKTSKDVYASVALQLAAYRYADRIILSDTGENVSLPPMAGGAVLHVRPDAWKLVPVSCGPGIFKKFLALRDIFDWETIDSRGVIGFPIAQGGAVQTGTERRAS
ncbi:hypothetical protein [Streptomyces sp. NPDC020141]|uniref:hypothetical protein n=1 Tax=Streptomyces sp. NPDC020141 TaxID=3365065 RepID=UPI0037980ABF